MKSDTSKQRVAGPVMKAIEKLKDNGSFNNAEVAKTSGLRLSQVYAPIKRAAEWGLIVGVLRHPVNGSSPRISAKRWMVTGTWEMLGGAEFATFLVKKNSQLDYMRVAFFGPQSSRFRGESPHHHQQTVQFIFRNLLRAVHAAGVKCPGCCLCLMAKAVLPKPPKKQQSDETSLEIGV